MEQPLPFFWVETMNFPLEAGNFGTWIIGTFSSNCTIQIVPNYLLNSAVSEFLFLYLSGQDIVSIRYGYR